MNGKETDKIVDFIFSDKSIKWFFLILILGIILRFLTASHIAPLADEMVHGPHAIGFLHSGLYNTIFEAPLWFYLSDIFFKILGITMFSTRFLSFFFGIFTIILVYLIASRIFTKKIALLSSFLLATSYFIVRYTLAEMDLTASFFIISSIYFFIIAVEKGKFPYLSAVCLGLGGLSKTLSLFFVPAFIIAFFVFTNEKREVQVKKAVGFGLIVLLIFSPIIIYNYLWFKDAGLVDTYFAQYFDIGKARDIYAGLSGYNSGVMFSSVYPETMKALKSIFNLDPINLILGIIGFFLLFKLREERKYFILLLAFEISGFLFLTLSSGLATHQTTLIPVLCILAGFALFKLIEQIKWKHALLLVLLIIFLIQLFAVPVFDKSNLYEHLTSKSGISQLRDYANSNMDKNSIVLVDARIYRGRIAWAFNDFHYLESSYFQQIWDINLNLSTPQYPVKVYFVECAKDDCGWGTVTAGNLNDSSEQLVTFFSSASAPEKTILGGGGYEELTGKPAYKIYQATINFNPKIMSVIDSSHDWLYYPVNYKPKSRMINRFNISGFGSLLNILAWIIMILAIITALLLPIYIAIKLYQAEKK